MRHHVGKRSWYRSKPPLTVRNSISRPISAAYGKGSGRAEAAKAGASMALANNTKVIGRRADRGGKVIVYSRPCRRGGMIVRLPQDPSRSGVGKGASCGT